jgi:phytoene dehydrogenase-like protein
LALAPSASLESVRDNYVLAYGSVAAPVERPQRPSPKQAGTLEQHQMTASKRLRIVTVGAGINGLVAANYLIRSGHRVVMLERQSKVGGACVSATVRYRGREIVFAPGASVLGMMQDFVFKETGLARALKAFTPKHPKLLYFKNESVPVIFHKTPARLRNEPFKKCGECGDIAAFDRDLGKVVRYLRKRFRAGTLPTLAQAQQVLGRKLMSLCITGSARNLLDCYLTSDRVKVFYAISVTESGAVSLNEPYTAFTIPLMSSGCIFDGKWGFVKGGIWKVTEAHSKINQGLGTRIFADAEVTEVSSQDMSVTYWVRRKRHRVDADKIVLATDPLSAAKLLNDEKLTRSVSAKRYLGTGELAMIFDQPIEWTDDTGAEDFSSALRIINLRDTLDAFERSTKHATRKNVEFDPGFLEIYPEGPAMERLGVRGNFHIISVFFKNLGFDKGGKELPHLKRRIADIVLARIKTRRALIKSILLPPKDLSEMFGFTMGDIDHAALAAGQTFFERNYSTEPERNFCQLGVHETSSTAERAAIRADQSRERRATCARDRSCCAHS